MQQQLLQGKVALVAGAGRNNGRAIALALAREGADLVLVARSRKTELEAVADECTGCGVRVLPLLADLAEHTEVERLVKQGLGHFGHVDVLMSVAGRRGFSVLISVTDSSPRDTKSWGWTTSSRARRTTSPT